VLYACVAVSVPGWVEHGEVEVSTETKAPAADQAPPSLPAADQAPASLPAADHAPSNPPGLTTERVWATLARSSFAVMSHVTASGEPRSSGVVFGTDGNRVLVVVAADSWKARTIKDGQVVAFTVPVRRGGLLSMLFPIPPAVVSFHARAHVGEPCMLDRTCLPPKFARLLPPTTEPSCVLELTPVGNFMTYGVGVSLMKMRNPELSLARVPVG
jgi:hypothetical protein